MKNFIFNLIIIVLCGSLLSAALLVPAEESETADPQILETINGAWLDSEIYVDGRHVNNFMLDDPVLVAGGKVYIPMDVSALVVPEITDRVGRAEGGSIVVDPQVVIDQEPAAAVPQKKKAASPGLLEKAVLALGYHGELDHAFLGRSLTTGYKSYKGEQLNASDDIAFDYKGTCYGSEDFVRRTLGIDVCYRPSAGLYLSTDPDISAERWADSDTNLSFIHGMQLYIQAVNIYVTDEEAAEYEFLMRHVCSQLDYMTPKLLFGVIFTESRWYAQAGTSAVGLMQILLKYAEMAGLTREDLWDAHTNMEYGAPMLDNYIGQFDGDVTKALAAYNQGISAVRSDPNYDTSYARLIYSRIADLEDYFEYYGWNTEFTEQLVLADQ